MVLALEDNLLTQNTGSASKTDAQSVLDDNTEDIEGKKAEFLKQKTQEEPEITCEQLTIGKRLLNWRTILPLVIVIVALVYFAQKIHIDPNQPSASITTDKMPFNIP